MGGRDSKGLQFFDKENDKLINSILQKKRVVRLLLSFPGNRYKLKAFLENKPADVSAYIDNFVKMIDKEAYTDIQGAWRNEG